MRRIEAASTKVHGHDPCASPAVHGGLLHGAFGRVAAALGALRRWWAAGRHYHPERRYMRGGQPTTRP
jgi:hypothetical protein